MPETFEKLYDVAKQRNRSANKIDFIEVYLLKEVFTD